MRQLSLTDDRLHESAETSQADTASESSNVPDEPSVVTDPNPDPDTTNDGDGEPTSPIDEEDRNADPDSFGPVAEHPAVEDVAISEMVLESGADGSDQFPHPARITAHIDEDMDADTAVFPDEVQDAIDSLTDDPDLGEFLVFDAADAYEYLETLQKKSDLHLENFHRRQLVVNQLSNGRGYAKGSSLSTYDKKWICNWEVRRRLAERDFEKWGNETRLSKQNTGLPDANGTENPSA